MSYSRKCDKCKEHFEPERTVELQYVKVEVGHYHTIHLCESCQSDFKKFLREENKR